MNASKLQKKNTAFVEKIPTFEFQREKVPFEIYEFLEYFLIGVSLITIT